MIEILAILGFILIVAMLLIKTINLTKKLSLYNQTLSLMGLVLVIVGWLLIYVVTITLVPNANDYTITAPSGTTTVTGNDFDYYQYGILLQFANVIGLMVFILTIIEQLYYVNRQLTDPNYKEPAY